MPNYGEECLKAYRELAFAEIKVICRPDDEEAQERFENALMKYKEVLENK